MAGAVVAAVLPAVAPAIPAQTASSGSAGVKLELAASLNQPVLSGDARRYWSPLGSFRPGIGGRVTLGYDWSSYGAAVSLEGATASVGQRSGGTFGLAVLGSWAPPVYLGRDWRPRAILGYVREGMLMSGIRSGDVDPSATRFPSRPAHGPNTGIAGNGARVGLSFERARGRMAIVTGVDVDILRLDTVTDANEDISLDRPSWSAIPHIRVGLRFRP
jgi:hypothetical protein